MGTASAELTDTLTLEGFYQFKQEEMEIDPSGSYFSLKDTVGPGATHAMIGFGSFGQPNMESWVDNPLYGLLEGEAAKHSLKRQGLRFEGIKTHLRRIRPIGGLLYSGFRSN